MYINTTYIYIYIHIGHWLFILLSSIYYQQQPPVVFQNAAVIPCFGRSFNSPKNLLRRWLVVQIPIDLWGKRSLDPYYRCFWNPAKQCSSWPPRLVLSHDLQGMGRFIPLFTRLGLFLGMIWLHIFNGKYPHSKSAKTNCCLATKVLLKILG